MFTSDRDLLILEPRLFFDVAWTAQRLVDLSTAAINTAGDTLTAAAGNFAALNILPGMVAIVAGTPLEITQRIDATTLRVSRLRASDTDPAIPAAPGTNLKLTVHTFRPQMQIVHDQLLRMLGIEPSPPVTNPPTAALTESAIVNSRAIALAEALGTLHLVYTAAAAVVGTDSPMWAKALMYRDRFAAERRRLVAEIDLNADGLPDATRRASVFQFVR